MAIITGSNKRHYLVTVTTLLVTVVLIAAISGCYSDHILPPCDSENLEIWTWYDLDSVRDNLCGNHTLMNDLDSNTPGYLELAGPIAHEGRGWEPIGYRGEDEIYHPFKGTFDGQGYEIKDLFIHQTPPSEFFELGLFGYSGAAIKNVGIVNATIIGVGPMPVGALVGHNYGILTNSYSTGNVSGHERVGGLVGYNRGTVTNCYSTGNITGVSNVGGLVGHIFYGEVSNSYATGSVTSNSSGGGLVGRNSVSTVSNSYATGNVTGDNGVGGLVGTSWEYGGAGSTISNSYSTGTVTGNSSVGGLLGENTGTVSNSFWDTQTSGQATSDGGTGKTTALMKNITTFSGAGWDIITVADSGIRNPSYIWNIVNAETYPFLSWQS